MRLFLFFTILSLYLGSASFLYDNTQVREQQASTTAVNWQMNPDLLQFVCGEFKGVVSTLLALETGAYLGAEIVRNPDGSYREIKKKHDWNYVERLIRLAMALDPCFSQVYILSQGHLPWAADKVKEQNEILDLAINGRFWDWQPMYFKAFNLYYFFNKYQEAGELLIKAGDRNHAPDFLPILGARLAQKGGQVEGAILLLKSMLLNKDTREPDYQPLADRLQALQGVLVLTKAAEQYKKDHGHIPSSVSHLVTSGLLSELPENPYGVAYCIDTVGAVHFDNPRCRKVN